MVLTRRQHNAAQLARLQQCQYHLTKLCDARDKTECAQINYNVSFGTYRYLLKMTIYVAVMVALVFKQVVYGEFGYPPLDMAIKCIGLLHGIGLVLAFNLSRLMAAKQLVWHTLALDSAMKRERLAATKYDELYKVNHP